MIRFKNRLRSACFIPFDSQRGWHVVVTVVPTLACSSAAFVGGSLRSISTDHFKLSKQILLKNNQLPISFVVSTTIGLSSLSKHKNEINS